MSTAQSITSPARYVEIEDGFYRVGDDGSVWTCRGPGRASMVKRQWRQMKPTAQSRGHMIVSMGRKKYRFVHRLVLEAFVGSCPEGMECRHLDGNPGNNRIDNLAWGTRKENQADSVRHGTAYHLRPECGQHAAHLWDHVEHKGGEKHHRAKLTGEQVRVVKAFVVPGAKDGAATKLAEIFGVTPRAIMLIAQGKRRCTPNELNV